MSQCRIVDATPVLCADGFRRPHKPTCEDPMYDLPPPEVPIHQNPAAMAKCPAFVERLRAAARNPEGVGRVVRMEKTETKLTAAQVSAFWEAVAAELVGTPWKLEPSGMRDGGATRRLVPAQLLR